MSHANPDELPGGRPDLSRTNPGLELNPVFALQQCMDAMERAGQRASLDQHECSEFRLPARPLLEVCPRPQQPAASNRGEYQQHNQY
jgi:hypothetical protein